MDKQLLEYLMALEMAALAEEGNCTSLSRLFGMAALEAAQRLGPAIAFSQEAPQDVIQEAIHEALQDTDKASPKDGPLSAGPQQPRSRRRRGSGELAGTRGVRRNRKHPLHAVT